MKLVRDSGQSAKRSAAVRGQAGRGATVAGGRRPDAAEENVGIFWPARFCGGSRADLLLEQQSTALLPSCETHVLPFLLLKMPALDRVKIMSAALQPYYEKADPNFPTTAQAPLALLLGARTFLFSPSIESFVCIPSLSVLQSSIFSTSSSVAPQ